MCVCSGFVFNFTQLTFFIISTALYFILFVTLLMGRRLTCGDILYLSWSFIMRWSVSKGPNVLLLNVTRTHSYVPWPSSIRRIRCFWRALFILWNFVKYLQARGENGFYKFSTICLSVASQLTFIWWLKHVQKCPLRNSDEIVRK